METRAHHVRVGIVTLALMALVAAFLLWATEAGRGQQQEFDIFFKQSVEGLSKGVSVNYAGVPAGQVSQIELWTKDPSFVRVRIEVDKKIPILQGTVATVQGSFTGGSTIQLNGGIRDAPPISEPGPNGVPVIPTRRGGLGEILANAPVLLDRLATLTERLNMLLSDKNQTAFANILSNTDRMTGNLADASSETKKTLTDLQAALQQAQTSLAAVEKVAGSANTVLGGDGRRLAKELRETLSSAKNAADQLEKVLAEARPAMRQLSDTTLPEAEATLRDLRATTKALRSVTEKIDDQGAGSLIGGPQLPDYKP